MSRALSTALMLFGGGTAAAATVGGFLAYRRSRAMAAEAGRVVQEGGTIPVRLTAYYPVGADASEAKRRMEGGPQGAAQWRGRRVVDPSTNKRVVLRTLEDARAGKSNWAALSGDPAVWPWGQALWIDVFPGVLFRVVDTGDHFKGVHKVVRVFGREPLDVRIAWKGSTKIPEDAIATIVKGDVWGDKSDNLVAFDKAGKSSTVVGAADYAALARAVESSAPAASIQAKQGVAWAVRNRAARLGVPVSILLCPEGRFGRLGSGGRAFAPTDREPSAISCKIAIAVLHLPREADPTGGAVDFWRPGDLRYQRILARAAGREEDNDERYDEDAVRAHLAEAGLLPCAWAGGYEFLGCG